MLPPGVDRIRAGAHVVAVIFPSGMPGEKGPVGGAGRVRLPGGAGRVRLPSCQLARRGLLGAGPEFARARPGLPGPVRSKATL